MLWVSLFAFHKESQIECSLIIIILIICSTSILPEFRFSVLMLNDHPVHFYGTLNIASGARETQILVLVFSEL